MDISIRSRTGRKIIAVFIAAVLLLLASGAVLDARFARDMKQAVAKQFNVQQMVIAHSIKKMIESRLDFLQRELILICRKIPADAFDPESMKIYFQDSLFRVAKSGVLSLDITDMTTGVSYIYTPQGDTQIKGNESHGEKLWSTLQASPKDAIWMSRPEKDASGIILRMGRYIDSPSPKVVVCKINLSWFLGPLMRDVRSGKTGYAWVMDNEGVFLFHPESGFIGDNAFKVREERDPNLNYHQIDFIQKDKMLKGLEGTGSYITGWHRGITGQIEKLIAWCPIDISYNPPQKWSVAVVAPVAEIEQYISNINTWRFVFQGIIIFMILLAGTGLLILEIRWTKTLEKRVDERTRELKKSKEKYSSLVESAEDFIFSVDSRGVFQAMNSFTANFFGGSPDDFIGKRITKVMAGEAAEKQLKMLELVYTHKQSVRDDIQLKVGDHSIWISANFMPIRDDDGEISSVLCIARDITEAKNLEKQLLNTEKLAALGTLAAGVAHEINNPLGVILGFCDLLIRKKEKDSPEFEDLKTIERQGLQCKQIVKNLLRFARHGEGATAAADINQCLEEILDIVRHTLENNNIELVIETGKNIPPVRGDSRELQQVFLNMINNAGAAMKGAGTLIIRSALDKFGRKAVITFKDTGCGIRPEDMDHIFEPFFTTKPEGEGTGLGLSVSYGIISRYGGSINCISTPENSGGGSGGTIFTVKLPIHENREAL